MFNSVKIILLFLHSFYKMPYKRKILENNNPPLRFKKPPRCSYVIPNEIPDEIPDEIINTMLIELELRKTVHEEQEFQKQVILNLTNHHLIYIITEYYKIILENIRICILCATNKIDPYKTYDIVNCEKYYNELLVAYANNLIEKYRHNDIFDITQINKGMSNFKYDIEIRMQRGILPL